MTPASQISAVLMVACLMALALPVGAGDTSGRAFGITIESPDDGTTITGGSSVNITGATTAGTLDVWKVEVWFGVSGLQLASQVDSSWDQWYYVLTTTGWLAGEHTVNARVTDTSGFWVEDSIALNVTYESTPPSIEITSPAESQTVTGALTIAGTASDDVSVARVEVQTGATVGWANASGTESWSFDWNTTGLPDGTEVAVSARAFDDTGTPSEVVTRNVTIDAPPGQSPPEVNITSPSEDEVVEGVLQIAGAASDADGDLDRVEYRINDGPWTSAIGNSTWAGTWDANDATAGEHIIQARAWDDSGRLSPIASVRVTVAPDSDQPVLQVDWVYPVGGEQLQGISHRMQWDIESTEYCFSTVRVWVQAQGGVWNMTQGPLFPDVNTLPIESTVWPALLHVSETTVLRFRVEVHGVCSTATLDVNATTDWVTVHDPLPPPPTLPSPPSANVTVLVLDPSVEQVVYDNSPLQIYDLDFWPAVTSFDDRMGIVRIPPYWPLSLAIEFYNPDVVVLSDLGLAIWDQSRLPSDLEGATQLEALGEFFDAGGGIVLTHATLSDWGLPGADILPSSAGHLGVSEADGGGYEVEEEDNLAVWSGLGVLPVLESIKISISDAAPDARIATLLRNAPLTPSMVPFSGQMTVELTDHDLSTGLDANHSLTIQCPYTEEFTALCASDGTLPYTMIGWQLAYPDVALAMLIDVLDVAAQQMVTWANLSGLRAEDAVESWIVARQWLTEIQSHLEEIRSDLPQIVLDVPEFNLSVGNESVTVPATTITLSVPAHLYARFGPAEIVAISDDDMAAVLAWEDSGRTVVFTWKPESTSDSTNVRWMANSIAWAAGVDPVVDPTDHGADPGANVTDPDGGNGTSGTGDTDGDTRESESGGLPWIGVPVALVVVLVAALARHRLLHEHE